MYSTLTRNNSKFPTNYHNSKPPGLPNPKEVKTNFWIGPLEIIIPAHIIYVQSPSGNRVYYKDKIEKAPERIFPSYTTNEYLDIFTHFDRETGKYYWKTFRSVDMNIANNGYTNIPEVCSKYMEYVPIDTYSMYSRQIHGTVYKCFLYNYILRPKKIFRAEMNFMENSLKNEKHFRTIITRLDTTLNEVGYKLF